MASSSMVSTIGELQDYDRYRELTWEGSFEDYLEIVRERPAVTRNAYQRVYDMIIRYGTEEYTDSKKKLVRYNFFRDEVDGRDAIYGLDIPLMRLVSVLKAAAQGFGPEKRIILLHGPVGSSKSTIVRLIKKGLEHYSRTIDGALYTYDWVNLESIGMSGPEAARFPSPMNEEPLRLIPLEWRAAAVKKLNLGDERFAVKVVGEVNPACRYIFTKLLDKYDGDWSKVIDHVRVRRLLLSEQIASASVPSNRRTKRTKTRPS